MNKLIRSSTAFLAIALGLAGCGTSVDKLTEDHPSGTRLIAESEPDNAYLDIHTHTGELHIDFVGETACHWIEVGQTESQRAYVYWPYGSSSNADGTVIFDADGEERARVGSSISTRGHSVTELTPDMINCSKGIAGASWWAAEFEPLS